MKRQLELRDHKNSLMYAFWSTVQKIAIASHFERIEIKGVENLPKNGPFILISNHVSRWDGLLVYNLLNRPSNFMVSPNELLGFQGRVLVNMGSFPANPRFDLQGHVERQFAKSEPVVIFPEGDVYRDDTTHPFKTGAAKMALAAAAKGRPVPIIPMAIHYTEGGTVAKVVVAPAVRTDQYMKEYCEQPIVAARNLTERLQREVSHLRISLGSLGDKALIFTNKISKSWAPVA